MRTAIHLILLFALVWLPISQAAAWCCPAESEAVAPLKLDVGEDHASMPCHGDTSAEQKPDSSWNDQHEDCQQNGCGHLGQASVIQAPVPMVALTPQDRVPNHYILVARTAHMELLLRPPIPA